MISKQNRVNKKNRANENLHSNPPLEIAAELSHNAERLNRHLRSVPLPNGITPERLSVLKIVACEEPISVSGLAQHYLVRPTTMSRMITSLAADGFVKVKENFRDGRRREVSLTAKGRRVWRLGTEQVAWSIVAALERLRPADQEIIAALADCLANLSDAIAADLLKHGPQR